VESSKGEWSRGQHEINFTHDEPLAMSDMHVLFKQGVRELASQHGKAVTFMAKYAPSEAGNSCHLHMSLWKDGRPAFWDESARAGSPLFRAFLGGLLRYCPELCLLFAPTINSYKRYQAGSWAPTRMAWSTDNRTCGFRIVGHGKSFRIENRMPGADANVYLAFAAMLAAGMAGIEEGLDCGAPYPGNAYVDPALARLPSSLAEAASLLEGSSLARRTLGDPVVEFLVRHARLECDAFGSAVTDWEKARYFEQV
jgi:glutamine synthetase